MKKTLYIIFFLLIGLTSYSQDEVFNHKVSTENVDIKPHTITDGMFRKEKPIINQRNEDEGR